MKLVCAALALLGLVAVPAQADRDAHEVVDGLVRFRSFGSADGLHNLVILSFAQDAAGLLWIGTDDGVFRYDGERFSQLGTADGLPAAATPVLGLAPDGNVCAGGAAGLACWDGRRFTRAAAVGLPDVAVFAI
ncbi:MAG: two-component regulator propeller domain-containing protein, partial [Kofleriaceae bacterium]